MTLKRKLVALLATLLMLGGLTGVAVAADNAAPGDTLLGLDLYGVDLALEAVGIGDGQGAERMAEAATLATEGRLAEALEHAAQGIANSDHEGAETADEASNAYDALYDAAEQVAGGDVESESAAVRAAVADMLRAIAEGLKDGDFDGQSISQMVSDVAGTASDGAADNGDVPEDIPAGPPTDVPAGP